ncbi:putative B3 domain-containing protein At5g58280 [Cajanus cajan]|uniref:putative B3 domain-containing protein At5g58280 n=1 Tax=Cajanus cajan TaxID=3821 RepID=UPI00098D873F|nr:putative B3 domain-containing protein At5g58280 [Cajanus cajan]
MAKGCSNNEYEKARKQRLEENKKRFEDLGISRISKNLTEITSSAKKTLHHLPKLKPKKTNGEVEPRRSSRVRNPVPSYREDVSIDLPPLRKRSRSNSSTWGSYVARPLDEIKEATEEERLRALQAAEALQINLNSSNPSFIKSMVRSHVYSCFWLGLPSKFCEEHLPRTVYGMVLEDENGSEYEAVYIGNRSGISGGWRAFALDHKLDDGDALVFELIEGSRFKIYIVRAFPDSVEEKGMDILEKEGNMHETKVSKAACNIESESKTKKPKQAAVYKTTEPEFSQEHLPDGVNPTKKSKSSQKEMQKTSKGKVQIKTDKSKAAVKLSNKTRKRRQGITNEIGDLGKLEKNGFVQDAADCKLEKLELIQEATKCVSQKARKKPAPKYFRKKA